MKVQFSDANKVRLCDLRCGDTFMYNQVLYLMTDVGDSEVGSRACVQLVTGKIDNLLLADWVDPVSAYVVVE